MARARNIKPGFFKNEDLGTADPFVSLLFAGLWTLADKSGIVEDRPLRIKAELFPYRDGFDINGYLTVLLSLGFIHRYEANGIKLIQIANFKKHQNPHHTEKDSEYPDYSTTCQNSVKQPLNNGDTPADSLNTDSLIPDSLNTDSLIPDSLNTDSLIPDSLEPTAIVASKLPTCPQKEILAIFADELSELPQPRVWDGDREKNLRSRWRWVISDLKAKGKPHSEADAVDFFRRMFAYIRKSDFLMGRSASSNGWYCPGLSWIVKASNFAKIIEGAYENKEAA